jgi:hypothetical protein
MECIGSGPATSCFESSDESNSKQQHFIRSQPPVFELSYVSAMGTPGVQACKIHHFTA